MGMHFNVSTGGERLVLLFNWSSDEFILRPHVYWDDGDWNRRSLTWHWLGFEVGFVLWK